MKEGRGAKMPDLMVEAADSVVALEARNSCTSFCDTATTIIGVDQN